MLTHMCKLKQALRTVSGKQMTGTRVIGKRKRKRPECAHEGCTTRPTYNNVGESTGLFCAKHAQPAMINVVSWTCAEPGCTTQPSFNNLGESAGLFCAKHAKAGMINVARRSCAEPGCTTQPNYNNVGESIGLFCVKHAKVGMIDVKNKTCAEPGCTTRPTYNNVGESTGLFCVKHAKVGMINVVSWTCAEPGCTTRPTYNNVGESTGLFCTKHAQPAMVDVVSRACAEPGCTTHPSYNTPGESKRLFCAKHAKVGMVNVARRSCAEHGCTTRPTYNNVGESTGLFCTKHAKVGMIYVVQRKCTQADCSTSAWYNHCGLQAAFCVKHKADRMVPNPRKHCEVHGCKEVASHGPSSGPLRCEDHCQDDDMDFRVAPCKQCGRDQEYLDKDGLCRTYCSPTKLVELQRRWQKKLEEYVLKYLDDNLELPDFVTHLQDDKTLDRDCNLYRPDRVYDCGTHYTVVEVDEGQHKDKGRGCVLGCEGAELKRMHEIQVAAGLPCVFLRFNPDGYTVNGKVGTVNLQDRLVVLTKWLQQCFKMRPTKAVYETPVKYKYLFYDEYHASDRTFQEVNDEAIAQLLASL